MAARRPARRRGDGIAVLRPLAVPSGTSALSLLPLLADALGGDGAVLPVPADDARQTSLLTASLRAGEPIDDDIAVVVSTSGTTGVPKGAMLTASALTASAEATHRRLGGPGRWLLALPAYHVAGLQVLVRSVVAGTTPVAVDCRVRRGRIGFRCSVTGVGSAVRVVGGGAAGQGSAGSGGRSGARIAGRGADRRRADAAGVAERASAARISVVRTYGMSETAGGCVYDGVPLTGSRVRVEGRRHRVTEPGGDIDSAARRWRRVTATRSAGSVRGAGLVSHRRYWRR